MVRHLPNGIELLWFGWKMNNNNRLFQIYYSYSAKGLASKAFHFKDTRSYKEVSEFTAKILNQGYNVVVRELDGDSYKLISTTYTPCVDPFLYD